MRDRIFGWDYPPGCHSVPGDEPNAPCEICACDIDDCRCSECPICGEYGNPDCYPNHGLYRKVSDILARARLERKWEDDYLHQSTSYLEESIFNEE